MTAHEESLGAADGLTARGDGTFAVTTAEFEAVARPTGEGCRVVCDLPSLDAAVAGESVGDAVREGWFETLQLRLGDVEGLADRAEVGAPTVRREGTSVVVETTVRGPADAVAAAVTTVVGFVEGTWFQGVVPGYDYVPAVAAMRERAHRQGTTPD
ncbi:MAG: DUF5813 family protein [Halobacteriaceae archaeon]